MKKGVYLINTARGELVDTEALVVGLKEGIIAGAGLDVLEEERTIKENNKISILNHELMKMPNVIITPHIAFYSKEAVDSILQITLENIKGFVSANPINIVK
jgi:D-lactate dehydrogenase